MGKTKGKAMKKQNASRQKEAGAERSRIKKPVIWGPTEEGAELISPCCTPTRCSTSVHLLVAIIICGAQRSNQVWHSQAYGFQEFGPLNAKILAQPPVLVT
ncbi:uncharacterized protein LOC116264009 isoform X1 [Nymphaea colorata]|nr:uncharacterized protein LOC116264009 isoform X1 [Nymphaea colorata]